jgi:hypothetical protein
VDVEETETGWTKGENLTELKLADIDENLKGMRKL